MRIILDQDQILCKWSERIVEWWNEDHGTSLTVEDIKSWDVGKWLGPSGEYFVRASCRYPELYRDLEPVEGCINGVKKLIDAGHDVIVASAVPKMATISYVGKIEWLRRQMPFFPIRNFIAIHRKDLLSGDILFDDGPHNIEAWNATKRPAVVMDAAWNRQLDDNHLLGWRVKHWNEFLDIVRQLDESAKTIEKK